MTSQQIEALRKEVESMAAAGATPEEFREWANTYAFGIEDLYEVVKLMLMEQHGDRQQGREMTS